jgi:ABC-type phosphate transport system permease subunit
MQASMLLAFVLGQNFFMHALAIPIRSLAEDYSNTAVTPASGQYWSKQEVLTLIGVCVGVVTVIIGLVGVLVASPKIREWLCMPIHSFKWRVKRSKQISMFLLQVKIAVLTTDQLQEPVAPRPYHKAGH